MGLAGPPNLDPAVVAWWDERLKKLVATKAWGDAAKEMFLRQDHIGADRARAHVDKMHEQHLAVLREVGLAKK
jgi:putative tricarboxylic transport membrane protein